MYIEFMRNVIHSDTVLSEKLLNLEKEVEAIRSDYCVTPDPTDQDALLQSVILTEAQFLISWNQRLKALETESSKLRGPSLLSRIGFNHLKLHRKVYSLYKRHFDRLNSGELSTWSNDARLSLTLTNLKMLNLNFNKLLKHQLLV